MGSRNGLESVPSGSESTKTPDPFFLISKHVTNSGILSLGSNLQGQVTIRENHIYVAKKSAQKSPKSSFSEIKSSDVEKTRVSRVFQDRQTSLLETILPLAPVFADIFFIAGPICVEKGLLVLSLL